MVMKWPCVIRSDVSFPGGIHSRALSGRSFKQIIYILEANYVDVLRR